ncbi:T9SS type A sorting domain-containing protein [Chitinophaga agrisoli]|uniref:T9SS type A sorting domain-containing protein n=1 Tax=Chitinophaga agrisoli TaxID=2607653 RepID=A0A5B2W2U0_9BACT|nr:T9SS type A sorting domain-containing protein [Chitinophaga agrisoli]KAA2244816.1 T9SS type A sorting domain-containing protein [Chitinophaga agrisoli]
MKSLLLTNGLLLLTGALLPLSHLSAQVTLQANGPGSTYELIESVLGNGTASETPDCAHPAFGRHITEVFDNDLNKNVFVFHIHNTPDNDRCTDADDRQRNEIKTFGPSPANLKGALNETVTYRWKFKLDAGFIPTSGFCHIHQIKAGDGDDGAPIITLTPRAGNPQKMQVIHSTGTGGTSGEITSVNLSSFKGVWVEVYEKVKYAVNGSYEIVIKRVSDGVTLLSYSDNSINMWRDETTFCRPKWGIYRKLVSGMRDEQVRFADFCIAEGNATCPSDVNSTAVAAASIMPDGKTDAAAEKVAVKIFPNPTQHSTTIELALKEAGRTTLEVYDMQQRLVATLLNSELQAGTHRTVFDLKNVAAGNYVVHVVHNGRLFTKMIAKQ